MRKIIGFISLGVTIVFLFIKGGVDMNAIAIVAATLVIKEEIFFKDVPKALKPKVKAYLESIGMPELAVEG